MTEEWEGGKISVAGVGLYVLYERRCFDSLGRSSRRVVYGGGDIEYRLWDDKNSIRVDHGD